MSQMESWIDIINDDAADPSDDRIILPPKAIYDLNNTGTLIKEIRYKFGDSEKNKDSVIRTETKYEIIDVKKKVSREAENRSNNWIKFGACSNVPKGTLERGISTLRDGNFPFDFNGRVGAKQKAKKAAQVMAEQNIKKKAERKTMAQIAAEQKQQSNMPSIRAPAVSSRPAGSGYRPPAFREGGRASNPYSSVFDEDNKVEIKISNLPQWSEFMNVKQLIDQFRRTHLHQTYIPKYKIRMIPSKRTLEEWHKDPKTYAHRLAEYERLAIVEFEDEKTAKQAIRILDGHHYDSHILRVEKAKPRNM